MRQLTKEIKELGRNRTQLIAEESELKSRLQKLPANTSQAERAQADLDETRQVIAAVATSEQNKRSRLLALQDSPEYRITTAVERDNRRPTKANISGVWTSGPNFVGYTIQLEQRGHSIAGKGFYWGCVGIHDVFRVSGSYQNNKLSLTFRVSAHQQTRCVYHYFEERRLPRFQVPKSKDNERIIPSNELH